MSAMEGRWLWRHPWASGAMIVLGLACGYYGVQVARAYHGAPEIPRRLLAEGRLPVDPAALDPGWIAILLAVEDPGFYGHHGVDMSTPGAGLTTITQALVKIDWFHSFSPGLAKIEQTLVAYAFDARIDKPTQLRMFVNQAYLGTVGGRDVGGFDDGARTYFGKPLGGLTGEEFIGLVAMLVAPFDFSLTSQVEANRERSRRIDRLARGACAPTGVRDVMLEGCR